MEFGFVRPKFGSVDFWSLELFGQSLEVWKFGKFGSLESLEVWRVLDVASTCTSPLPLFHKGPWERKKMKKAKENKENISTNVLELVPAYWN